MAYSRRLGADEGTVLFACSICGGPYRYPTEMRYCSDRLFRCNRTCTETTNPTEENQKQGRGTRGSDEIAPRFKVGVAPDWYDS